MIKHARSESAFSISRSPKRLLIIGASRGIGQAVAQHFASLGHNTVTVSRTPTRSGHWIQADISTPTGLQIIASTLDTTPIDALLFMGGTWETNAFTSDYNFLDSSDAETRYVMNVNAIAPIELTRLLVPNLIQTPNPRAIFIGSLSGLENSATAEVANTASKFALRGAAQALKKALIHTHIGFTTINPGNVATEEVLTDITEGRFSPQNPIPLADLISAIQWLLDLSPAVDVQDVNLQQKRVISNTGGFKAEDDRG